MANRSGVHAHGNSRCHGNRETGQQPEYQESLRLGKLYGKDGHVETARQIIRSDFAEPTRIGVIRLREHLLFRPEFPVGEFIGVLKEIFQA